MYLGGVSGIYMYMTSLCGYGAWKVKEEGKVMLYRRFICGIVALDLYPLPSIPQTHEPEVPAELLQEHPVSSTASVAVLLL